MVSWNQPPIFVEDKLSILDLDQTPSFDDYIAEEDAIVDWSKPPRFDEFDDEIVGSTVAWVELSHTAAVYDSTNRGNRIDNASADCDFDKTSLSDVELLGESPTTDEDMGEDVISADFGEVIPCFLMGVVDIDTMLVTSVLQEARCAIPMVSSITPYQTIWLMVHNNMAFGLLSFANTKNELWDPGLCDICCSLLGFMQLYSCFSPALLETIGAKIDLNFTLHYCFIMSRQCHMVVDWSCIVKTVAITSLFGDFGLFLDLHNVHWIALLQDSGFIGIDYNVFDEMSSRDRACWQSIITIYTGILEHRSKVLMFVATETITRMTVPAIGMPIPGTRCFVHFIADMVALAHTGSRFGVQDVGLRLAKQRLNDLEQIGSKGLQSMVSHKYIFVLLVCELSTHLSVVPTNDSINFVFGISSRRIIGHIQLFPGAVDHISTQTVPVLSTMWSSNLTKIIFDDKRYVRQPRFNFATTFLETHIRSWALRLALCLSYTRASSCCDVCSLQLLSRLTKQLVKCVLWLHMQLQESSKALDPQVVHPTDSSTPDSVCVDKRLWFVDVQFCGMVTPGWKQLHMSCVHKRISNDVYWTRLMNLRCALCFQYIHARDVYLRLQYLTRANNSHEDNNFQFVPLGLSRNTNCTTVLAKSYNKGGPQLRIKFVVHMKTKYVDFVSSGSARLGLHFGTFMEAPGAECVVGEVKTSLMFNYVWCVLHEDNRSNENNYSDCVAWKYMVHAKHIRHAIVFIWEVEIVILPAVLYRQIPTDQSNLVMDFSRVLNNKAHLAVKGLLLERLLFNSLPRGSLQFSTMHKATLEIVCWYVGWTCFAGVIMQPIYFIGEGHHDQ